MLLVPETLDGFQNQLRAAIATEDFPGAVKAASGLSSGRVAKVLREEPRGAVVPFLHASPPDRAGRILGQFPTEFAASLLADLDGREAGKLFSTVPPDRAADILQALDEADAKAILDATEARLRERLVELREFRPGSAGGVMTPHFLAIDRNRTVGQTLDALLAAPPEVERTSYVYVVDEQSRPLGVLSVKDLMRVRPETPVVDAMTANVVAVHVDDEAVDAARLLRNRRFTMLPVVDANDALVGIITFDDAMDILAESVAEQFAGIGAGTSEESFFTPPGEAVKKRLPWMAMNVFLNLGAVAVITGFEDTIAQVAILAAFLPMITDMGGNVGIQSLSVAIRSIALGEVRVRDFWKAARKEVAIGLINGAALGTLFAIVAYFWQGNPWIGALAGIALGVNVLIAGVVGGTIPFLIKRMGKDPAMMTGPVLTTITDITGVSIYLGLCTIFLGAVLAG